jgi:hypothetical protein
VISVHILCLDDCFTQSSCHNGLKSLNSFSVSLLDVPTQAEEINACTDRRYIIAADGGAAGQNPLGVPIFFPGGRHHERSRVLQAALNRPV